MQNTDKTSNKVHFETGRPAETVVLWLECAFKHTCVFFQATIKMEKTSATDAVLCCYYEIHDRCFIMSASLLHMMEIINRF